LMPLFRPRRDHGRVHATPPGLTAPLAVKMSARPSKYITFRKKHGRTASDSI
jgi:hypothetical protein